VARSLQIMGVIAIVLIVLLSKPLFAAQAMSNSTPNEDITAALITSKFAFIDSNSLGFKHIMPNAVKPIKAYEIGIIQPPPNLTAATIAEKIEPIQPFMDIDKTISNAYEILFIIIDNKAKQQSIASGNAPTVTVKEKKKEYDDSDALSLPPQRSNGNPSSTVPSITGKSSLEAGEISLEKMTKAEKK
jgi:hypothetical protein